MLFLLFFSVLLSTGLKYNMEFLLYCKYHIIHYVLIKVVECTLLKSEIFYSWWPADTKLQKMCNRFGNLIH